MIYGSVCSGIEAASAAWHPLGWRPAFFSEIEAFPRAVLRHHFPDVPLHGRERLKGESDEAYAEAAGFQTIGADEYEPIDLLVGGTPCQSFSIAGLRGGMADGRGNLALEFIRLARRKRARWVAWENVPGVFSSNGGDDFGCFLSGLAGWHVPIPDGGWQNSGIIAPGPGNGAYGLAWRVLDAQHFGVPQRRRRVFVVGYIGNWRRAAAVLFERHSLSGDPPPSRKSRKNLAAGLGASLGGISGKDAVDGRTVVSEGCGGPIAPTLNSEFGSKLGLDNQHIDGGAGLFVQETVGALTAKGPGTYGAPEIDAGQIMPCAPPIYATDGQANAAFSEDLALSLTAHNEQPYIAQQVYAIQERAISENPEAGPDGAGFREDGKAYTLEARSKPQTIAFTANDYGNDCEDDLSPTLRAGNHSKSHANGGVMPAVMIEGNEPAVAFKPSHFTRGKDGAPSEIVPALSADADKGDQDPVVFQPRIGRNDRGYSEGVVPALAGADAGATSDMRPCIASSSAVRRLIPLECERLQGFPDHFTLVPHRGKPATDGPRYKALGNSMAVPVMAYIGRRIELVEAAFAEAAR